MLKRYGLIEYILQQLENKLIQGKSEYPIVRTFGHPFMILPNITLANTFLSDTELRQLHRRFGHPSVNRLIRVLERSGHDDSQHHRIVLEKINKFCHYCQKHGKSPMRFKFTIKNDTNFNHTVFVDVFYISGDPVLHLVDEATKFQAARWLNNMTAESTWNAIRQCWIDVYIGPPDVIIHDSGSNFTANEFQNSSASMGILTKCVPVESHNSMGIVERYHAPLRRAYEIICEELKDEGKSMAPKSLILQMAVKAVNDTAGPDGLVPTLLVFGTFPRMSYNDPPSPSTVVRAKAIGKAMQEISKLQAQRQVSEALNARNGPRTQNTLSVPIGGEVLVWRIHKKEWSGPHKVLDINNETVTVQLPHGPTQFRSTSVKPYYVDTTTTPDTEVSTENKSEEALPRRNPQRNRQLPTRFRQQEETVGTFMITENRSISNLKPSNFLDSRRKEVEGLLEKGVFEIVSEEDIPTDSSIFRTRFVDQIKHEGTPNAYHKSRLVVQAYNDDNKHSILTQAPTIQRVSQRLLLCCATLVPNSKVALRDISQAYTQSTTRIQRNIFVKPVKELEIPSKTLLRVVRPLYGIPEAGTHWFNTYQKHHIQELNMETSTYDSCLLYTKDTTNPNDDFGIVGLQTDDTLTVGSDGFLKREKEAIEKAGFIHKPIDILTPENNLNFNGSILSLKDNNITVTQRQQISNIKKIDLSQPLNLLKTHYTAQRARGAYVATVSQPEASFALSHAAQCKEPTAIDVEKLNKCLEWQIKNIDRGIKFVKLDLASIKIVVFTDSAFANNSDYSSQIGYVIVLADDSKNANILHWSSTKCRRVTRSVLASELYALVHGFDMASVIKTTLEKILKPWHSSPIPLITCTDSHSLFDCLVKIGTTNEKRLMIDIMCLRQAYERREITEIVWIPGQSNPADSMTKEREKCCKALKNLIDNNVVDIDPYGWVQRS